MTRDLLAVQMSVVRDRAPVGLSLLGELAQPAFKPWDVEDFKETLRIDRNYLKAYDMLVENLHDVIFRFYRFRQYAIKILIGRFNNGLCYAVVYTKT